MQVPLKSARQVAALAGKISTNWMPTILVGAGRSQFANLLVGDSGQPGSLFLPDIEIVGNPQSHCAASLSDVLGHGLPVFIENHPDIGQITGRRVRI